jgi:CO/xanthine dehydrogenase FAD-binding subunit
MPTEFDSAHFSEQRRSSDAVAMKLDLLHSDVNDMKLAITTLATSINRLAVVEERLSNTSLALERAFKALEKVEQRVNVLETTSVKSKETSKWVDKAIYAGVAAAVVYIGQKTGLIK